MFSGKKLDWPVWSEKFLARANRKGYKSILLGEVEVPNDEVETDLIEEDDERKKQSELKKKNQEAYEDLVLSIDGESDTGRVVFQLVKGSKSTQFKDGDAREVWKRFKRKFEPAKAPSRLALKKKILKSKLKYNQDSEIFISQLEDLVIQYNKAGGN